MTTKILNLNLRLKLIWFYFTSAWHRTLLVLLLLFYYSQDLISMECFYTYFSLAYSFFKLNLLDYFLGTIITRTWGHTYLFSFIWPNYVTTAAAAALYLCIFLYLSLPIEVCNFLYFPTLFHGRHLFLLCV